MQVGATVTMMRTSPDGRGGTRTVFTPGVVKTMDDGLAMVEITETGETVSMTERPHPWEAGTVWVQGAGGNGDWRTRGFPMGETSEETNAGK